MAPYWIGFSLSEKHDEWLKDISSILHACVSRFKSEGGGEQL